jgi:hypothetical protein
MFGTLAVLMIGSVAQAGPCNMMNTAVRHDTVAQAQPAPAEAAVMPWLYPQGRPETDVTAETSES